MTVTPGPNPIAPSLTPSIDEQARKLAATVAPQFEKTFGVQFNPIQAQGQNAAPAGGSANDLVGVAVPVASGTEALYEDDNGRKLEVWGLLSVEPPLYVEIMIAVENAPIQYSRLQTGTYMIACTAAKTIDTNQRPDCIAVSEQEVEFAIRSDTVDFVGNQPYGAPSVDFICGSVHGCFTIRRRRICVRAF